MAYNHGVRIQEVPTSIVPPVNTQGCLPVFFGTAPVHLAKKAAKVNEPVLCYTYQDVVEALGYSEDWSKYTLCEAMYSQFKLYGVAPVVFVNVLDLERHKESTTETLTLTKKVGVITEDVIMKSLVVERTRSSGALNAGTDYVAAYNEDGHVQITILLEEELANVSVTYDKVNTQAVAVTDLVGGVDDSTGEYKGLEAINGVFSKFGIVPGQIAAPGWSHKPEVAAVMTGKVSNINGLFEGIAHTDIPTDTVKKYADVAEWKNNNGYTSAYQTACWPKVKLGDKQFHMSTIVVGVSGQVDAANGDIPYESPSNKAIKCSGLCLSDGTEVSMHLETANYLNSQGVMTALNMRGWVLWGNEMACYPANTDPKDRFLAVTKMFNWHRQTFILTYFQKVDKPMNRRLIDSIVDSENIRLNGLVGQGVLIAGRIEFRELDNPITSLIDGIATFYTYFTPPVPAREIVNKVEFDPMAMKNLFQ